MDRVHVNAADAPFPSRPRFLSLLVGGRGAASDHLRWVPLLGGLGVMAVALLFTSWAVVRAPDLSGGQTRVLLLAAMLVAGLLLALLPALAVYHREMTRRWRAERALAASQESYRTIAEAARDGIMTVDADMKIQFVNPAAEAMLGYEAGELLGRELDVLIPPGERDAHRQGMRRYLESGKRKLYWKSIEFTGQRKDGRRIPLEMSLGEWTGDGRHHFTAVIRDIGERKRAERALRESEERYALAAEGSLDGLWDWDLEADRIHFSRRWKAMIGYGEKELDNRVAEWFTRVHSEDIGTLKDRLASHLEGRSPHLECEYRLQHRDGGYRWMLCRGAAVRRLDGVATRIAGSQTDISARKTTELWLLHEALHDPLTGLPNRAYFLETLRRRVARTRRRRDYKFAVLFVDLDRFKAVNDGMGHAIGDQLLVATARFLQSILRPEDSVARYGGDEFVILFDDLEDFTDATRVAERIEAGLASPFRLSGLELAITASIGIALSSSGYETAEEMMRDADAAMYRAKQEGRSRYAVFDPQMQARAVERLRLEEELRGALERGEFGVRYQPVVDLASGRPAGFEALLRWERPGRGETLPGEFLAVLDEMGLLGPVRCWILGEVCGVLRAWSEAADAGAAGAECPFVMSVNLSEKELWAGDLAAEVARALAEQGVPPGCLALEIREEALVKDPAAAAAALRWLREIGVRLYLDDYGSGPISLGCLKDCPVDGVKISRSLIRAAAADAAAVEREVLRALVEIPRHLGKDVIAAGVETGGELALLRELGCRRGQGLLLGEPLEAAEARAFLRRSRG